VAADQLTGRARPDDDLTALLRPAVDPESTWADAGSWAALSPERTRPETLLDGPAPAADDLHE
jgi:hypothetical protein